MKIVILDRKTLGYDIDVSVFEKFGNKNCLTLYF